MEQNVGISNLGFALAAGVCCVQDLDPEALDGFDCVCHMKDFSPPDGFPLDVPVFGSERQITLAV